MFGPPNSNIAQGYSFTLTKTSLCIDLLANTVHITCYENYIQHPSTHIYKMQLADPQGRIHFQAKLLKGWHLRMTIKGKMDPMKTTLLKVLPLSKAMF